MRLFREAFTRLFDGELQVFNVEEKKIDKNAKIDKNINR